MPRRIRSVVVFVLLGATTGVMAQLPPEILADQYLLQAEELLSDKAHEAALDKMGQILALQKQHGLTLPDGFHFQYAQVAFASGAISAARDSLNQYLVEAGRTGEFYREALKLLNQVEAIQKRLEQYPDQVEQLMAEKDYGAALELMNQIVDLQEEHRFPLPEEFHFQYAQAALATSAYWAAADSINKYLGTVGGEGKFYQEAQELLARAEQEGQRQQLLRRIGALEMVVIPGGSFRMGCVSGRDCDDDEHPVHEVRVESFELGKYEVTFEEYDRFTAATGRDRTDDKGWGRGRRPVIRVTWEAAEAYTRWLSEQTGERYRLPSEAEWEYAARAGTETKYHFGKEKSELCLYGNHADRSTNIEWRNQTCSDGVGKQTALVGTYQPNGFGLYDMHGNVWEWVQDCWNRSYQGAPTDGAAWESGDCSQRVLRGGSWFYYPRTLRSAYRIRYHTMSRVFDIGFRVARTITPLACVGLPRPD